jgi:peptidoglycan hydrolase CwlO-like protein
MRIFNVLMAALLLSLLGLSGCRSYQSQYEDSQEQYSTLLSKYNDLSRQNEALQSSYEDAINETKALSGQIETNKQNITQLQSQVNTLNSSLKSTQDLLKQYEAAVAAVLAALANGTLGNPFPR